MSGRKENNMSIQFRYETCERYTDDRIEVYANEASVGTLNSVTPEQLTWSPDERAYNVKFQFRNPDTFLSVVNELKCYKEKNGYKYLTIWTYNNGYAEVIDNSLLEKAGFKHLPNQNPACMFLE
jgi:hypothetical protein